ncbi:hypothetical protein [Kribbella sp. VKM Ac-2566]|uniref:hypothetical protein n=1 Tax=Kribbella sp. VKM Ac-2566 TaxID=2512218 RepID=UPI001062431E|nr:hypothetical protein [Kribbella sp. VKM Ac-2566]TDW91086.1 hypothetical protein EV647_4654 [Kribbella sp. VKM Ac-2566]
MTDNVLSRAGHAARTHVEPGWVDISATIKQRLRTITRRSRPIRAAADNGITLFVTDHVLISALRRAIAELRCELDRVQLICDGDTCTGAVLDLVTSYGQDLHEVARHVRTTAYGVFTDLLGPIDPPFGADGIDIVITGLTTDSDHH